MDMSNYCSLYVLKKKKKTALCSAVALTTGYLRLLLMKAVLRSIISFPPQSIPSTFNVCISYYFTLSRITEESLIQCPSNSLSWQAKVDYKVDLVVNYICAIWNVWFSMTQHGTMEHKSTAVLLLSRHILFPVLFSARHTIAQHATLTLTGYGSYGWELGWPGQGWAGLGWGEDRNSHSYSHPPAMLQFPPISILDSASLHYLKQLPSLSLLNLNKG